MGIYLNRLADVILIDTKNILFYQELSVSNVKKPFMKAKYEYEDGELYKMRGWLWSSVSIACFMIVYSIISFE